MLKFKQFLLTRYFHRTTWNGKNVEHIIFDCRGNILLIFFPFLIFVMPLKAYRVPKGFNNDIKSIYITQGIPFFLAIVVTIIVIPKQLIRHHYIYYRIYSDDKILAQICLGFIVLFAMVMVTNLINFLLLKSTLKKNNCFHEKVVIKFIHDEKEKKANLKGFFSIVFISIFIFYIGIYNAISIGSHGSIVSIYSGLAALMFAPGLFCLGIINDKSSLIKILSKKKNRR